MRHLWGVLLLLLSASIFAAPRATVETISHNQFIIGTFVSSRVGIVRANFSTVSEDQTTDRIDFRNTVAIWFSLEHDPEKEETIIVQSTFDIEKNGNTIVLTARNKPKQTFIFKMMDNNEAMMCTNCRTYDLPYFWTKRHKVLE